jgi:hypothetical protein
MDRLQDNVHFDSNRRIAWWSFEQTQEKVIMSYSKLPIQWSILESQLTPFNSTCLKIVARGESRAARDSHYCERAWREEHQCNKSDAKTNILTNFSLLGRLVTCNCDNLTDSEFWMSRNLWLTLSLFLSLRTLCRDILRKLMSVWDYHWSVRLISNILNLYLIDLDLIGWVKITELQIRNDLLAKYNEHIV